MVTYDYDVLIVGGGLVGGSLALALTNTPLRVGLIEAQTETERLTAPSGLRALALSRGTHQILDQLGLWETVRPKAMPIRHIHVSERGRFGKTRLHAEDRKVDALGYVLVARHLEAALTQRLATAPRVETICPAHLMGLKAGAAGICVTLRHGSEERNLTARLLVAADGGNSTVRRLLDISQITHDYGQTAIVTEVTTTQANHGTAYERFTPSGPLAMLPLAENRSSVVWTLTHDDASEIVQEPAPVFTERLQEAFGYWLGTLSLDTPPQAFPLKRVLTGQMTDERVVFIGNALHQLHPVAGQGFNLGLRDAAVLAEHLSTRAAFGEDWGDKDFLDRYAQTRKRDLQAVVHFTDSLVKLFSNDFPPLGFARSAALTLLDCLPPAKRLLAGHAMGYGVRI